MVDKATYRHSFSKIPKVMEIPNLLAVQLQSYENFVQRNVLPEQRKNIGLHRVFNDIFPIEDTHGNFTLEYLGYTIGEPKFLIEECQERDMTYAVPLKATLRLIIRETVDEQKRIKDVIQQEVYLGELPLITETGTFIVNGAERVIVCQLHRSPGVVFSEDDHITGKKIYSCRIIPYRGSWVEFTLDTKDVMYVHIDRHRKIPVTILLKALGLDSEEEIANIFKDTIKVEIKSKESEGSVLSETLIDMSTGEILAESTEELTSGLRKKLKKAGIKEVSVEGSANALNLDILEKTIQKDPTTNEVEALIKIYTLLRPGDPPNVETARNLLEHLFFNDKRYDLGDVGRHRVNQRLNIDVEPHVTVLTREEFTSIIKYLLVLRNGKGYTDDIDHLGNRRIRSVGELLSQQLSVGLSRMARTIRERMSIQDADTIQPSDLINARTLSAVVSAFFGSSQLSQFMDQVNPLAELTHKRRLSALGPGGLTRDRAGFEVRDVHHSHYGRMCPIETPEGPNIGLITSLCTYTRVNDFGFLETPYRKVVKGKVTSDVIYLSADKEDDYTIAQANAPLEEDGSFKNPRVKVRQKGDLMIVSPEEIELMDIAPTQIVSVAASLIPFLEHDDANRALMGSNMQRQAVPLLKPEPPIVGTGMESKAAIDSGAVVIARRSGTVISVSSDKIAIEADSADEEEHIQYIFDWSQVDEYSLTKFKRSNQDTAINYRPSVAIGDKVKRGAVIADGPCVKNGELALGKNLTVAFMPWGGYNFEDAIVISERIFRNESFSSVHIVQKELEVRDTKRGPEEITREIPNVSQEAVRNLDEDGIVRIGAEVRPGDILVGKVTPKGETELSPEERLLRAIFGEKAGDVRDASLKAQPGLSGVVVDVKVFSRREKDERSRKEIKKRIEELKKDHNNKIQTTHKTYNDFLRNLLVQNVARDIQHRKTGRYLVERGRKLSKKLLNQIKFSDVLMDNHLVADQEVNQKVWRISRLYHQKLENLDERLERDIEKIQRGDELSPGIVKLVKVYIARKKHLSVGDKMAGRHGNKGVVAKIVPEEDMPFMADGTTIDIILNPLGVPSRMNVGQLLETMLGWAGEKRTVLYSSPVFDGAMESEIRDELSSAELPESSKSVLYDGRTGEPFDQEITVGKIYIMKLSHLVDDKLHARSTGPYSLVTQQPLGGKAQFGGQRFGEMEVWALEAYGAAYTLQEILTVKSDDVIGRSRIYEAIVKGENTPEPGIPESFNVLVKELQSLGLNVLLEKNTEDEL